MTTENQAAIEFVRAKLVCAISQLEKDLGITMAYPVSSTILEAVQACDDFLRTDADLHGCDPIREGSQETPEWEDNPR